MLAPETLPKRMGMAASYAKDAACVVVCGGRGERLGLRQGKALVPILGMPMALWSVQAAAEAPSIDLIVVVCRQDDEAALLRALSTMPITGNIVIAKAGRTRQASVAAGLSLVPASVPYVCIHDGARPLVSPELFEETLSYLRDDSTLSGAIAAYPATDTLKVCERGVIQYTPKRSRFWYAQTPQTFRTRHLREALAEAVAEGWDFTDDASAVERWGGTVVCVKSSPDNLKITVPEDLEMAEALLSERLTRQWEEEF